VVGARGVKASRADGHPCRSLEGGTSTRSHKHDLKKVAVWSRRRAYAWFGSETLVVMLHKWVSHEAHGSSYKKRYCISLA